jgi:pantoate--beta-alanine ligase
LKLARTIPEARALVREIKTGHASFGFVPTMGALHNGHISLVKRSLEENHATAVSIFVNPTQFNEKKDFQSYPRNLELDLKILERYPVNLVFAPGAGEIYPEPDTRIFDFGGLDSIMEGSHRPGHFNGVAQIVSRLFEIIEPGVAYFGEKDFQQLAIIRKMTKDLGLPVRITGCPIIREEDGLAMSSRNRLLSPAERTAAARIPEALLGAKEKAGKVSVRELVELTIRFVQDVAGLEVEYFEIVEEASLKPVSNWNKTQGLRGCIAVRTGNIRLIDNMDFSF